MIFLLFYNLDSTLIRSWTCSLNVSIFTNYIYIYIPLYYFSVCKNRNGKRLSWGTLEMCASNFRDGWYILCQFIDNVIVPCWKNAKDTCAAQTTCFFTHWFHHRMCTPGSLGLAWPCVGLLSLPKHVFLTAESWTLGDTPNISLSIRVTQLNPVVNVTWEQVKAAGCKALSQLLYMLG